MELSNDYDYIFNIINYLAYKHDISFFITSKDFDILYGWWEKKIPPELIKKSIDIVTERWIKKGKNISGFSNFSYEVRKKYKALLELNVNIDDHEKPEVKLNKIEFFFNNYPPELNELKAEFKAVYSCIKNNNTFEMEDLNNKLLVIFKDNRELEIKNEIFLNNIAPELRKPEISRKFRLNYIKNKFRIPDFDRLI